MTRLTLWLAFLGAVKGGRERIRDEIDSLGVGAGLNFRLGDGGWSDAHATDDNVKFWVDSFGQERVAAWQYSRPDRIDAEILLWQKIYELGVRRFCINAESHWKIKNADLLAASYVEKMRKRFPDCEISHAPFAFRVSHGTSGVYGGKQIFAFPYRGFGDLDCAYDQLYVEEFGMTAIGAHARYDREMSEYLKMHPEIAYQKRSTIADLYGSDLNRVWGGHVAGQWTQNSFDRHIENAQRRGETDLDFYTIDASLAETDGTPSKPWPALQKWCRDFAAQQCRLAKNFSTETEP